MLKLTNFRSFAFSPFRLFALFALFAPSALSSQPALVKKLDSIAESGVLEKRTAGLAAAVVRGNDTLLLKAYGKADVEWNVPLPVDAMFEIGSITKQFTAAALLQLRDAGKLSLDDEITKWLPDFDTRGNKLTLRRLLDHTSGIVGLTEMPEFGNLSTNSSFPRDSGYALIKRYPFQFPTGEAQIYNNSAFWLLGLIVEKASGMTYEDYVEKKLFEPLGMKRSMYCNSSENVERRAHGYQVGPNGAMRRAAQNVHTWPFSAGSLCSTAGDLVTWLKALHGGKVLSAASYAEMIKPSKLNDGTPLRYGMGISVGKDSRGLNFIGHGGGISGFTSYATWYPDAQAAIVVLMNSNSNLDPGAIAGELAAEIQPWTRSAAPKQFAGDAAPLLGRYKGPSRGRDMVVEVTKSDSGVTISVNGGAARSLPWVEGWTFQQGQALLTFRRAGENGPATELRFNAGGGYYILKRQ